MVYSFWPSPTSSLQWAESQGEVQAHTDALLRNIDIVHRYFWCFYSLLHQLIPTIRLGSRTRVAQHHAALLQVCPTRARSCQTGGWIGEQDIPSAGTLACTLEVSAPITLQCLHSHDVCVC